MKKFTKIVLSSALIVLLSSTSVFAWGGKTHYYGTKKYFTPLSYQDIEDVSQGAMNLDFGFYELDTKTGVKSDSYSFVRYLQNNLSASMSELTFEEMSYVVGNTVHYRQDTTASIKALNDILESNDETHFYHKDNSNIPTIISDLRMKAYVDTFVTNKIDKTLINNYYKNTNNVPYNYYIKAYKSLKNIDVTRTDIQKGIVANNILSQAFELINYSLVLKDETLVFLPESFTENEEAIINNYLETNFNSATSNTYSLEKDINNSEVMRISDDNIKSEINNFTKEILENLIINNVVELSDNGSIIINNEALYNKGVMDLYNKLDSYISKFYGVEDINKDAEINILDLSLTSNFYNIDSKNENYVKKYDINADGIIDLFDLTGISNKL